MASGEEGGKGEEEGGGRRVRSSSHLGIRWVQSGRIDPGGPISGGMGCCVQNPFYIQARPLGESASEGGGRAGARNLLVGSGG